MAISKFKATCLAVMDRVGKTGVPILVTRFGIPVAEIHPPRPPERPADWLGSMAGTAILADDLTAPATEDSDWEALA